MIDARPHVEEIRAAYEVVEPAHPEPGHDLAHFLGNEEEIIDDVLRLPGEFLAQFRILGRDADRAGIEMALAHHDAAGGDQRRSGKPELVRAQHRSNHDIAAGPEHTALIIISSIAPLTGSRRWSACTGLQGCAAGWAFW